MIYDKIWMQNLNGFDIFDNQKKKKKRKDTFPW